MPARESNDRKVILVLGADKETGSLLSRCLSRLTVKMCEPAKDEEIHAAVKTLLEKESLVGLIADPKEKPEPLANAIRSTGVKALKYVWCLCDASEELEEFFPRQPSEEVLVIDPDHFRKNLSSGCEQLYEFCGIGNEEALARAKAGD